MYKYINDNKKIILFFLTIICTVSFIDTVRKGLLNGCDFQWQPSVLFWQGINHYEKFISNGNWDFMCQGGQYSQLFHVILYPFTLFEWETARFLWVIVNSCLAFMIVTVLCKNFNIPKYKTILLILIFLSCYPTRMTINYGQQSLFVLFFLILPFIYKSNFAVLFGGLSAIKYSTGYILFLDFIVKKQYKNFLLASILYILGWIIYFLYTKSNPIVNFFQPIEWSLQHGYKRDGDIYSLLQIYILGENKILKYISIILIFTINMLFLIKINKIKDNFLKMSLILICPLIFFPHSNYDYVLLFPLACYSLLNFNILLNKINFYFVIYFFYLSRQIKHLLDIDWLYQPILLTFIIIILLLNIKNSLKN
jgi:hypothetical protein